MGEELKPCPFCGGHDIKVRRMGNDHTKNQKVVISCSSCRFQRTDATIRHGLDWVENIAIMAWNTRAEPERHVLGVGQPHWADWDGAVGCQAIRLRHPDGGIVSLRWPGSENLRGQWRFVLEKEKD